MNDKFCFSECRLQNECVVTNDRDYLGNGNVDLFDALVIQIRFFLNDKGRKISKAIYLILHFSKKDKNKMQIMKYKSP